MAKVGIPVIGTVTGNGVVKLGEAGERFLLEHPGWVYRTGKWRRQTPAEHRASRHEQLCKKYGKCDCAARGVARQGAGKRPKAMRSVATLQIVK